MLNTVTTTRGLRLRERPDDLLSPHHIETVAITLPRHPQLLLRPRYISVDPYMRTRMHPMGYDYIERWEKGSQLSGWTLAEVMQSQVAGFAPGNFVVGHLPMQESVASSAKEMIKIPAAHMPLSYLHPLGMTGFTAWVGMELIGAPTPQDTVLVNAAAGAVGSLAAQLAKRRGARVIVTAGRADKREWLYQQGFEEVLDHRHPDYAKHLDKAAPSGISLHFENVGGTALQAAIETMRQGGRIVLCGLVSQYQSAQPRQGPRNMATLVAKNVAIIPFVVPHYLEHWCNFQRFMAPLVAKNQLSWRLDEITGGIDSIATALIGVLNGDNLGKRVVKMNEL
ncbi:NADP-dependent oxidoreductase [Halomonas sp. wenzhen-202101]|uniref:NADP-dependent oxidoreductase n=2 Tax=Halomonas dongshanensis TaxID=2890835 RepID=A0ABT2E8P9_9GAMM|nr:NADP-dependent oxidoreductase [Halomonas dongshanensis]MCS2607884.1 NADP-dependent oxidoreductase [Halomonas dongshanensis]